MATIRDVAKASGVSIATVSHVLRGRHEKVSAVTRERVMRVVRELQYRPPAMETNQSATGTRVLAVVVPDLSYAPMQNNQYFAGVFEGILEAAALRSYAVTILIQRMWSDVGSAVRSNYDGRCDGTILIGPSKGNELVERLQERGTPLVLVGSTPWLPGISCVDVRNEAVAATAAEYLSVLGHRRMAFFGSNPMAVSAVERSTGFRNRVKELGLEWCGDLGSDADFAASTIAATDPESRPTAIFGWNDRMSYELVRNLKMYGLRVPQDVSVVAVDDSDRARECDPPLTTFRQPLATIGLRAGNLLIDRIENPSLPEEVVHYSAELIIRESACAISPDRILLSNSGPTEVPN